MDNEFLAPGSDAAREAGCQCPILDNAHGRGYMGQEGVFVFVASCPVHSDLPYEDALNGSD